MLKQSTGRLFLTSLLALLLLVGMLAVPIRRDYSTSYNNTTGVRLFGTNVHYGLPFAWITFSKLVDKDNKAVKSQQTRDNSKLLFDVLTWGVIVGLYVLTKGSGDLKRYANIRN